MRPAIQIIAGISASLLVATTNAQDCGKPSGAIQYSEKFVLGQMKIARESDKYGTSGELFGVGKGSADLSHLWEQSEKLDIDTARSYIQDAYSTQRENIVAECGYRMCLLQSGQRQLDSGAVTLYAEVCRSSLEATNNRRIPTISVKPTLLGAMFADKSSPAQTRRITIFNTGDGQETLRVDSEDIFGKPILRLQPSGTIVLNGHSSKVVHLTIVNPQAGEDIGRGAVRFQIANNPDRVATSTVTVVASPTALAPFPSIDAGFLNVEAEANFDTDHVRSNPFGVGKSGRYPLPVGRTAAEDGFQKYGTKGYAGFEAGYQSGTSSSSGALIHTNIWTRFGGSCGDGSSGGGGRVAPRWESKVFLPPTPKGKSWTVEVSSVAKATHEQNYPLSPNMTAEGPGKCIVTIGTTTGKLSVPGTDTLKVELPAGTYPLTISCDVTAASCRGKANGVTQSYINFTYDFAVEARRDDHAATSRVAASKSSKQ